MNNKTLPTEYYQLLTKYNLVVKELEDLKKGIITVQQPKPEVDPFTLLP